MTNLGKQKEEGNKVWKYVEKISSSVHVGSLSDAGIPSENEVL